MKNLEVYFNKLPNSCLECPCFQSDEMSCGLDDGTQDYFKDEIDGGKCPLKKIHSHDLLSKKIDSLSKENSSLKAQLHKEKQEIVNEVCESIRGVCKLNFRTYKTYLPEDCQKHKEVDAFNKAIFGVLEFLDKIQREYEK